jgi:hypothetical protein
MFGSLLGRVKVDKSKEERSLNDPMTPLPLKENGIVFLFI